MTGDNWGRLVCFAVLGLALAMGTLPQTASAQDSANTLINIDGMVIFHQGIFRNATPADGAQTFQYGVFQTGAGTQGRYDSFYLVIPGGEGDLEGCCISHRIRQESWGPQTWQVEGEAYTTETGDLTDAYFPVIDRVGFGTIVNPAEYQIEVKFKPVIGVTGLPNNVAQEFNVSLDRHYGMVWNAEKAIYERGLESINYSIGVNSDADYNEDGFVNELDRDIVLNNQGATMTLPNENPFAGTPGVVDYEDLKYWENRNGRVVTPVNDWYATAPKDANGFATWKVPLTDYVDSGRTTNINYGDAAFRDANTVTGGGRVQNPDNWTDPNAWEDVPLAFSDTSVFGTGPEDPARPGSKLNTPAGINLMYFGKNGRRPDPVTLEVLSAAVTKINPGPVAARLDENSGITARFGVGFTRGQFLDPINVAGVGPFLPPATDQISRFDENGMTNLIFNMRAPEPEEAQNDTHRFLLRYGPNANTFNGDEATVNVRARLTQALGAGIAQTLTLVAKDLDGNDLAPMTGADEYTYNLALNQFNTSTFTTVSIPLSAFTLSTHVPRDVLADPPVFGSGPGGFENAGDGSRTEFNLYEFGGLLAPNTGLLKLELDYMEIRLPSADLLAGDYNNNGVVDAADYTLWRDKRGTAGPLQNDPIGGTIGTAQYNQWKGNFGMILGGGGGLAGLGGTNVPEPSAMALFACLLGAVAVLRRSR